MGGPFPTGESGDCRQQMDEEDGQVAHGAILKPKKWARIWQFATHTS